MAKSRRLHDYDYSSNGAYFITICTKNKQHLLCSIQAPLREDKAPTVHMSALGTITEDAILKIPGIEKYVIMPNHVHLIIRQEGGNSVSSKIRLMKSVVTAKAKQAIWQDLFYDHVIRDELDYQIKWKYIDDNPAKWSSDEYYSGNSLQK